MIKQLFKSAVLLLLFCIASQAQLSARSSETPMLLMSQIESMTLTVTQISPTSAMMNWSATTPGPYTVIVTDLTTSQTTTAFTTSNTSARVNGLVGGHTYKFQVSDGAEFIIIEITVYD